MRAKAAQTSRFDRVIDIARVVFDKAHKATVIGLVGLTGKSLSPRSTLSDISTTETGV